MDSTGNTPLIWAANSGSLEAVKCLVDKGVDVNVKGFLGQRPSVLARVDVISSGINIPHPHLYTQPRR